MFVTRIPRFARRLLGRRAARLAPAIAYPLGDLVTRFGRERATLAEQTRASLRLAFPERDEAWIRRTERRVRASHLQNTIDGVLLTPMRVEDLERLVTLENFEVVERVHAEGRGILLATLHFGRLVPAALLLAKRGYPSRTVVGRHNPDRIPEGAARRRRLIKAHDVSSVGLAVHRSLRQGHIIAAAIDGMVFDDASAVEIPFLGQSIRISSALITIAAEVNAVIIPTAGITTGGARTRTRFYEPLEATELARLPPEEAIRLIVAPLEEEVRRAPEQWWGIRSQHRRTV